MLPRRTPSARALLRHRASQLALVLCAGAALALPAPHARAGEIEGMRIDDATRVGGKELQLNGTGLRSGFVIKGYVAALYLPEKARNATVVLGVPGPKRLQIRPLREVRSEAFFKALNQGIRENHSEMQVLRLSDRMLQLRQTMEQMGTARKGDVIDFDFSPDGGTVVAINGTPRGRAIPGEDFYQAVLRIFLGDHPVDRDLKRGLLGG
ncbi:chalcone isomerase family protein [Cupriavidus sp. 2TAF22]|uniref:chalcone isomerase family protein n=1 Tax=unclassified Cupriavidus TaxID=2640874 RepID=UPI003F91BA3F